MKKEKSDVEVYWDKVRISFGNQRTWNELHPQEQHLVFQSVNMLLAVLSNQVQNQTQQK